jgi:hypothetical protein
MESPSAVGDDLATSWQRVVDEVMRKKPMVGAVLAQSRPIGVRDGELSIALTGNHFHRELLTDRGNRDLVLGAVRRWVTGAERLNVVEENGAAGDTKTHPAVQAALEQFEGEIVRVSPRPAEGEGQ